MGVRPHANQVLGWAGDSRWGERVLWAEGRGAEGSASLSPGSDVGHLSASTERHYSTVTGAVKHILTAESPDKKQSHTPNREGR